MPKLPGCLLDGSTVEEALKNTQSIIEDWIQDALEDVPEPDNSDLELSGCTVEDVSGYILHRTGPITAMMLEKLVYYMFARSIAWYKNLCFRNNFRRGGMGLCVRGCPARVEGAE